jgi:hypothetical protein
MSRRSVAVAAGVSGVLIASSAAFAVASGIFAGPTHGAGRVGSFEAVTQELVPAPVPTGAAAKDALPRGVSADAGPDDPTTIANGVSPPAADPRLVTGGDTPSPSPEHEGTEPREEPPTTVSPPSTVPETDPTGTSDDPPGDDNGHSGDD